VTGGSILLAGHPHQQQHEYERKRPPGQTDDDPGKVHCVNKKCGPGP
jgi:hypothetical protein